MNKQRNTYEYQVMRSLKRKLHLITLRGGKCEKCEYNKNIAALDFHHRDPSQKKFQLDQRTLSNTSMKLILLEFEKCDILCSNCHREHHSPECDITIIKDKILKFDNKKEKWLNVNVNKTFHCEDCNVEISKWGKKCKKCFSISRRKVIRPEINKLINEVNLSGYSKTAKKYGVTDKTIKKWITTSIPLMVGDH